MKLTKAETNNAIVTVLTNVRPHPNADKLKLATILGTQVVVGLDAKEGDRVVYFDSNLCLSPNYLANNNLYSNKELNIDKTIRGYFDNNGRVRAQKFRGEVSNGYVAEIKSLYFIDNCNLMFSIGDEFTHINDIEICRKYIVPRNMPGSPGSRQRGKKKIREQCTTFHTHWDTKQFMREYQNIPSGQVWIEEKIHGTSGRTGNLEHTVYRKWYQIWKPKSWKEYKIISGTRRMDHIDGHISETRKEIHKKLTPNLHKGETVYYEIFGHDLMGREIQPGFSYGCVGGEYKVMLYRVTITTPDGFTIDLPRQQVYKRAEELGLMKPILIGQNSYPPGSLVLDVSSDVHGNSAIANHMKEGVVVWFQNVDGTWSNLKHKSEEFLIKESGQKDNSVGDVEDNL